MIYAIIVLLILALLAVIDSTVGNRVHAALEIRPESLGASFTFLRPLLEVDVDITEDHQILSVKVFKMTVYKTQLVIKGKGEGVFNARLFARAAALRHICTDIVYGMPNPFSTSITYAILSRIAEIVPQYRDVESQTIRPDYLSGEEYLRILADANFSLCHTIFNYVKRRIESGNRNSKPESIRGYPVCEYEELFPNGRADR